ncbi:hypothetical protein H4582DRAFT_1130363 [Lactarius indigo]|nr:hypothetical protein H4582DRAFT_1130363 [Lactarius indigo]
MITSIIALAAMTRPTYAFFVICSIPSGAQDCDDSPRVPQGQPPRIQAARCRCVFPPSPRRPLQALAVCQRTERGFQMEDPYSTSSTPGRTATTGLEKRYEACALTTKYITKSLRSKNEDRDPSTSIGSAAPVQPAREFVMLASCLPPAGLRVGLRQVATPIDSTL